MSIAPQDLVEAALSVATLPCVSSVRDRTEANLRWANNGLITNGEMRSRTLTVTATAEVEGGTAAGTVSQEIADVAEVAAVVAAAEGLARTGRPAEDAAPMVQNYAHNDVWTDPPETTSIEVLDDLAKGLGDAFERAEAARHLLYGFAEHAVETTYLGSSTGLRRRGVQPTGRLELNAKTADREASAWLGRTTRDFLDVDVVEAVDELSTRLGWASTKIDLPPGRYETLLPPGAIADLMIYAYWTANARDAKRVATSMPPATARPRSGSGSRNFRSRFGRIRCIRVWKRSRSSTSPPPSMTLLGLSTAVCRSTRPPGLIVACCTNSSGIAGMPCEQVPSRPRHQTT